MFAKNNTTTEDEDSGKRREKAEVPAEALDGDRHAMYRDGDSGVVIASGGHSDPPYLVVMPDGTVHDAGLSEGDRLDSSTVRELFDHYGTQVY